jgi:hypothetical protein
MFSPYADFPRASSFKGMNRGTFGSKFPAANGNNA